jgi:hypothetical protein
MALRSDEPYAKLSQVFGPHSTLFGIAIPNPQPLR